MYIDIYNGTWDELILKCGRQTGKSTTNANFLLTEACGIPHFGQLYLSPSRLQTQKFSNAKLQKTIDYSTLVKEVFVSTRTMQNVLHKSLTNGSEIFLNYASDDPDRVRGDSSDRNFYDEVQDMLYDIIPVVQEAASYSDYQQAIYTGTPKSLENTMEFLWTKSDQSEWMMKCPGCKKFSYVKDDKIIGLKGPICRACGKLLDIRDGFWFSKYPLDEYPEKTIKGYHYEQARIFYL